MIIPLVTLAAVFLLIAIRQLGSIRVQIWQAMLIGAVVVLVTGQIGIGAACHSINMDVMLFLFGMFVVGHGLEESGYLSHLSYKYFKRARTRDSMLLMVLFGAGITSAILMNDTLAIIGTPVVLLLAKKHDMSPRLLLLALAFAVTVGSVMSPIGNPQNLLIALHGNVQTPFVTFLTFLLIPTIVNILAIFLFLKKFYPDDFHETELKHSQEPIRDHELAVLSRLSLRIAVLLVIAKIVTAPFGLGMEFRLSHIALAACLPIVVGSSRRWQVLRGIDWHTLVFFGAMFVLMESVWQTGFFQDLIQRTGVNIASTEIILGVSILLSQFISNVPLVALYLPLLQHAGAGTAELMALAAGSTIAGNMFILGAASNVIVIQNAEKRAGATISFLEFAKVGVPLTAVNTAVYWAFLKLMT
jgi:Na+/H+ antiporter NhaD/arsenite permease-like protein